MPTDNTDSVSMDFQITQQMLSVTLTFELMCLKCHQHHMDLIISNCDKFHCMHEQTAHKQNASDTILTVIVIFFHLTTDRTLLRRQK